MASTVVSNIIFDWSGVISDDLRRTYDTVMAIFAHLGAPSISLDQFREDFQIPQEALYRKHGIRVPYAEINRLYSLYWPTFGDESPNLISDAAAVLRSLSDDGYWLGIVSSHPAEFLLREVTAHGLADVFRAVSGGRSDKATALIEMMAKNGLIANETVFAGDMNSDIRSGKAAGVLTAGVTTGYQAAHLLSAEHPDFLCSSLADLQSKLAIAKSR